MNKIIDYPNVIKWIHWITAIFFGIQYLSGEMALVIFSKRIQVLLHYIFGFVILLLTVVRIYYFFYAPRPELPNKVSAFHQKGIKYSYISLYLLLTYTCISGIICLFIELRFITLNQSFAEFIEETHHISSKLTLLIIILHICGIILYYLRFQQNLVTRIWPK